MAEKKQKMRDMAFYGFAEGWISIVINIILFVLKYWAGIVSGSIGIIADAWHSLSDSISSIALLIGFKFAKKPPDREHPFGHGRIELIISILISVFLAMIGADFIYDSIHRLYNEQTAEFGTLAIVVTVISIVIKEALAQFAFWASRKTESKAIRADGWHHRSDAVSSLIIFIGIFLADYIWWADVALGIIVGLMILFTAYQIIRDTISSLIGENPDDKLIINIKNIVCSISAGLDPHHFHLHRYGDHKELTFHIYMPAHMKLRDVNETVQELESAIYKNLKINSTIKVDPKELAN